MKRCFFCLIAVFAVIMTSPACSTLDTKTAQSIPAPVVSVPPLSVSAEPTAAAAASSSSESPLSVPASPSAEATANVPSSEIAASPSEISAPPSPTAPDGVPLSSAPETVPLPESSPTPPSPSPSENKLKDAAVSPTPLQKDQPKSSAPPQPVRVPILYYHSINETPFGLEILSVRTSEFEKQIKYLAENGYTPIDLNEDPSLHKKPVVITLDDGYIDNFLYAYPILEKYGMKATIFVSTDAIGTPNYLSLAQIRSMTKRISFQSHGLSHTPLIELDEAQILKELTESKRIIETITKRPVYAFCYPYGDYDKMILRLTAQYYDCAVTINSGVATQILGNYLTVRVFVSRYDTLDNFIYKLGG